MTSLSTIPFGSTLGSDLWQNTPLEDFWRPSSVIGAPVTQNLLNVDLIEGINNYTLTCDVPGVLEKDIDVSYDNDFITIRAKRTAPVSGTKIRAEREFGNLHRRLRLPVDCDKDSAKATLCPHGIYLLLVYALNESTSTKIDIIVNICVGPPTSPLCLLL